MENIQKVSNLAGSANLQALSLGGKKQLNKVILENKLTPQAASHSENAKIITNFKDDSLSALKLTKGTSETYETKAPEEEKPKKDLAQLIADGNKGRQNFIKKYAPDMAEAYGFDPKKCLDCTVKEKTGKELAEAYDKYCEKMSEETEGDMNYGLHNAGVVKLLSGATSGQFRDFISAYKESKGEEGLMKLLKDLMWIRSIPGNMVSGEEVDKFMDLVQNNRDCLPPSGIGSDAHIGNENGHVWL